MRMSFEIQQEVAIRVSNLSKCYQIYDNPNDRLKQFVVPKVLSIVGQHSKPYFREFWALKDISFEIKKGETVGIIGRNGSGKSTLLQIICGTLHPTAGDIEVNGRVAALLELGSGFNPEFTGRENVYLNAGVLGLSNEQTQARFSDIEAFADIGDFIDQAVKTYSSGMTLRLAFAVIAHVDADILVVDEALAVGDAIFTQKCMRYIRAFQERGTLLFVSHDMGSVLNLCKSAIWLSHGVLRLIGESKAIAENYLQYTQQEIYSDQAKFTTIENKIMPEATAEIVEAAQSPVNYGSQFTIVSNLSAANGWRTGGAEILAVTLENMDSSQEVAFLGGERVKLMIRAKANKDIDQPILGFLLKDRLGQDLFGENTLPFTDVNPRLVTAGSEFTGEFVFNLPMLPNGQYAVMASVAEGSLHSNVQHHWLHDALIVNVSSSKVRWGLVGIQFVKVNLECAI